jgi:hypothetical protein
MKQCTKCKKQKDESEFCKRSRHKDGLSYWCKACESEYARKRYSRDGKRPRKYLRYNERHRVVKGVAQKQFYKKSKHKDGLAIWCKKCADLATNSCRRRRRLAQAG